MKLIDKVRSCKALEDDTDNKLSSIKESPLELTDVEALRNNLKGNYFFINPSFVTILLQSHIL
jgi:hypothetical protein